MTTNYKQLFAIKKKLESQILKACPNMDHKSGIYFYTRTDENGKYCYIGQAVDLLNRSVSHLQGYQHIDLSLRKRGFKSKDNDNGWELNFLHFPEYMLDDRESFYIKAYQDAGYEVYNIESGGSNGKTMINERKPSKTYKDGLAQGKKIVARELKEIIDKYLNISLKNESRYAKNGLDKFWKIINENIGE